MIKDLKPYPEMKDSGVEFLGEVPAHWIEKRAKYFYREADERSETGSEELMSVSHKTGVTPRKQSVTMFKAESTVGYKICRPDDIAINTMWAFMGALGVARQVGLASPSYGVYRPIRPDALVPEYVDRVLRIDGYKSEYLCRSTGINSSRLRLYPDEFLRIPIICPPLPEQAAIVRYLDYVDRRVRRLVRAKRKLIALLTEQKQALIHRAVTRGLDPDVPLKDSGVEWLGQVPEHWDVVLNQRIFKENIRPHNGEPETPLSLSQHDGLIATKDMKERSLQTSTYDNWKVTIPGDIVVNRFKAHLGVFFASTLRGIVSFHYGVFEPRREMVSKYFEYLYHTEPYRTIYAGRSNGMTVGLQNLSNQNFYNVKSAVPPLAEQASIVDYLAQATAEVETAVARIRLELELLDEYHTRVIADVVAGNLDVRKVVAVLPEVDPLDAADEFDDSLDAEPDLDEFGAMLEEVNA